MPPEGGEVIEGVFPAQAAGLDDAHEEISDFRPYHCFVKQGVVAVAD